MGSHLPRLCLIWKAAKFYSHGFGVRISRGWGGGQGFDSFPNLSDVQQFGCVEQERRALERKMSEMEEEMKVWRGALAVCLHPGLRAGQGSL